MEDIKIAWIELHTESERPHLSFLQKLRLKKKIKNAVTKTEYREKRFLDEDHPALVLPFTERELSYLTSEEAADILNRLSKSSGIDCFFVVSPFFSMISGALLQFHWVSSRTLSYLHTQELMMLCGRRLGIRREELKIVLVESYGGKGYEESITSEFERERLLVVKWMLKLLYGHVNYLSILTRQQDAYLDLAEQIFEDSGLLINLTQSFPQDAQFVIDASGENHFNYREIPKQSAYISFFSDREKERLLGAKRKDIITLT
ncbi:MAG: hypothetical protein QM697_11775 [Lachnospiraceae bacterium]